MFAQQFDHSFNDLFNQYVNMDTSGTDGSGDVPFPSDFEQMFPDDSLSTGCGGQSPTLSTIQHTHQPAQHWSKDAWCLAQNPDSSVDQGNLTFQDSFQPSAVSDLNIDFEVPSTGGHHHSSETRSSPSTPPATPISKAKGALTTPKTIRRHREPNDRHGLLRKQNFSPGLMRSSQLQKSAGRMAYPEAWAQRFQNFSGQSSSDGLPLSPPPSDILIQRENVSAKAAGADHSPEGLRDSAEISHQYDSGFFTHSPAVAVPSSATALAREQQRYLSQSNNPALTPSPPSADDIFPSPHSSDPQSMSSWNSDSLGTPAFPFTPDLRGPDAQAWWSPMSTRVPQSQVPYQHMIASPAPQRPIQVSADQNDLLQGGLMIQMGPSQFDMSSAAQPSFPPSSMPSTTNSQDNLSYNHGVPAAHKLAESSFSTPHILNQSRSPSVSPHSGGSPKGASAHNGMAMKTSQRRPYVRKLSGQSTCAPKTVKGPSGVSVSPRGSGKSVTVSFVNFTAQDSQKILTGVAPSGSSKTKARREQEARDRRRKLSEAAINAVRKAGGDVEALEAVFC